MEQSNNKNKESFFQIPKVLFKMRREGSLSLTAFDIYLLMSDRFRLSKKNGWIDEEGDTYIMYSYEELCEELNLKRRNSISDAIKELEKLNLIEKKRRYNRSNVYYLVDISDSNNNVTSNSNENVTSNSNENVTSNSNENVTSNSNENVTSNSNENVTSNSNINVYANNNYNNNNYMSNNYMNNNNKENVAGIIRQEIKFLIKNRKIKIENIIKYSNDLERIKQVFEYADKNKKGDGWIIACLRDNYSLNQEENQEKEKDYSKTMDEILRGG
ncbi:Replication initiator protein [Fusobacterium vincentii ATCC 49256]|uniref:Replication initiator protein n=1 Tax=Fusobacterium vincentii ATCC 49256 TaxID=209882 RepID=Q7P5T7_FUSVC|nr:Replication initiator protein [Fusobacterium vincentii ATCC 49256]